LVAESDWRSISCEVCHPGQGTAVTADLAWLEAATGRHEPVASTTALCEHCHTDTDVLRHRRDLGLSAHRGYTCTDCHDPHSTAADCTAAGCHPDVAARFRIPTPMPLAAATSTVPKNHPTLGFNMNCATPGCHASTVLAAGMETTHLPAPAASPSSGLTLRAAGHDPVHARVACVACHDASRLEVGPLEAGGVWVTWRTTELLGRSSTESYQSHHLQRAVDCERCHFPGNVWGLAIPVEAVLP
jgi:hypothetical protein